jgi:hypothetical protein
LKRNKNRIHLIIACLTLLLSFSCVNEHQVSASTNQKASEVTALAGITKDNKGNKVAKKTYVTRAEFAQMLVQASPYSLEAKQKSRLTLFIDVSKNNVKAAYIQMAVSKGYMRGYLGGTFKPNKNITLKEAIYGTLGILGYTNKDFSNNFSDARYEKYKELGLSKNINRKETDSLTITDCENLFYNLLNAKQKSGDIYGKVIGYTLDENGKIDTDALLTKKSKGPYVVQKGWEKKLTSKLSSYDIYINNTIATKEEIKDYSIAYCIDGLQKIMIYQDSVNGQIENITMSQNEPQDITISGTTYAIETPKKMKTLLKTNGIKKGMFVSLLLGKDDKISYILPIQSTYADNNLSTRLSFDLTNATIYKNDKLVALTAIKNYDLIYYSKELHTLWAFSKKTFGSLDSITYNQTEPQELTVLGTSYPVSNPAEMKKILKSSSIQTGMPVVLIFGWDEKVVSVLPLSSFVALDNWQQNLSFPLSEATIYKNGSKVTSTSIQSYDVIYYSKELKSLWIYDKKAYGILNSISPTVSTPSEIVVAGKTYSLKLPPVNLKTTINSDDQNLIENAWGKRLLNNGVKSGDNVVVLFGYNGDVADVYPVAKMPVTLTGYVLSVDNQLVKDANQTSVIKQVVHIVDTNGILHDFQCSDTTIIKGSVVEVSFQYGVANVTKLNSNNSSLSDITTKKLADNIRVIAVSDQNYSTISATELKEMIWGVSNTIYCKLNAAGEITDLILRNTFNTGFQYGILKDVSFSQIDESTSLTKLSFRINGTDSTISTDEPKWSLNIGPKAIKFEDNEIKDMYDLTSLRISYISGNQANTGNSVHRIADDVQVYYYKNGKYYDASLSDITSLQNSIVNGYIYQSQGPIQIIVVTN